MAEKKDASDKKKSGSAREDSGEKKTVKRTGTGTATATNIAVERPSAVAPAAEAFELLSARYAALDPKALKTINIDVPRAVSFVLGAIPAIEALIPQMERVFKNPPVAVVKNLRNLALGAWYAHLLDTPQASDGAKAKLLEDGSALRTKLSRGADALVDAGLFSAEPVAAIQAGSGNIDKANDLVAWAAMYTAKWDQIAGRTAITAAQVDEAARLGPALLVALSDRPLDRGTAAADARARSFTLLDDGYDEVRSVVHHLRWMQEDADSIAPSLYTKGKKKKVVDERDAEEDHDVEPTPTGGTPTS